MDLSLGVIFLLEKVNVAEDLLGDRDKLVRDM